MRWNQGTLFCIRLLILSSLALAFNTPKPKLLLTPEQLDGINTFTSEVAKAVRISNDDDDSLPVSDFISFTLKGPKAPRKTKKMSEATRAQVEKAKEGLRGKIREVQGRLIILKSKTKGEKLGNASRSDTLLIQSTIKFHGATDVAKNFKLEDVESHLKEIFIGRTTSGSSSDSISTVISEWGEVDHKVGSPIRSAELQTVRGCLKLDLTNASSKKKICNFIKKRSRINNSSEAARVLSHDQPKHVLLSPSALFLQKLGITDGNGKPKIARSSKLRQCQKFVEIVTRLVDDTMLGSSSNKIKVVDMGCGRGYLTFSLHAHLHSKYGNVQTRGIDMRPKLMKEVDGIARELGQDFDGLKFLTGSIDGTVIEGGVDVLIALHACDTATDDSLWYGIRKNASIIVSAPCCHKEARLYLDAYVMNDPNHPYADIFRHNIYKERLAETITDSMRALLLEIRDYNVKVFEFIGGEHTAKNIMITAVKRAKGRSEVEKRELRMRLHSLAAMHGIKQQKLAKLMKEPISSNPNPKPRRGGMPSLETRGIN